MNAIQQYLTEVAMAAIREASARLIRNGEVDPILVVGSMQELSDTMVSAADELTSRMPSALVYSGRDTLSMSVIDPEYKPMFFNPGADGAQS